MEEQMHLLERAVRQMVKADSMGITKEPDMTYKGQVYYLSSTLADYLCFGDKWTFRMWAKETNLPPFKISTRTYYNYSDILELMNKQLKKMPLFKKGNILKLNGLCILDRTGDLQRDYEVLLNNGIFRNGLLATLDLYLIKNPLTGHVKIGLATALGDRLRQLRMAAGIQLEMIHSVTLEKTNPYLIEDFLHKYYREKRRIGEWFELEEKDIDDIKALII